MSQMPTPPASRPGSEAPEKSAEMKWPSSELRQALDTLLEEYLSLLDRQQEMQNGLAKQLSSGFLSLAHANYTCPPGRRYGADYYDDRMKATRKISIQAQPQRAHPQKTNVQDQTARSQPRDSDYSLIMDYTPRNNATEPCDTDSGSQEPPNSEAEESSPSKARTSDMDENDTPFQDSDSINAPTEEIKKRPSRFQSDNPINWYGILVPPSLRTAQNAFTKGIQDHVPELAAVTLKMRVLEQEITQLRVIMGAGETA